MPPKDHARRTPVILVVDDEESNIAVFRRPCAKAGWELIGAANGAEALEALERHDPDVVLLDWMMPGMSGPEVVTAIKASPRGKLIPVILVTAKSAQSDIRQGLDAGADDYVTKPVQMEEALARIRSALRQRMLERELHETNNELKRLMALKDDLLNIAAHDIRAPLTSILGFAKILVNEQDGPLSEGQKKHLNTILRAGQRQLKLVNDLLDLSRMENGRDQLLRTAAAMDELLAETHEAMLFSAKEKRIDLIREGSCPAMVSLDEPKILRVLSNLVSNAIKFTPAGGRVMVSCAEEGNAVRVTVADTGPGIPEAEMPKLFGKFSKLSTRPTAGEHGSGLGLSIARNIVELHGGRIWAESAPGEGCRFIFTLPLNTQ